MLFADMGFNVDTSPLFQTPDKVVKKALEKDVHVSGISSLFARHKKHLLLQSVQANNLPKRL